MQGLEVLDWQIVRIAHTSQVYTERVAHLLLRALFVTAAAAPAASASACM
jgi:hypothetical protein